MIPIACASLGIPVRDGVNLGWGPGSVPWEEARAAWQNPCCCAGEGLAFPLLCGECGGSRPAHAHDPSTHGRCRWCSSVGLRSCDSCGSGLHYRGECPTWLRGAHEVYAPGPLEHRALCPDCAWLWVRALTAASRGGVAGTLRPGVAAHMGVVAAQCLPGAGEARAAARRAVAFPVRRALRWLLRRLRRISWIGVHRLTRECATALTAVDGHNRFVTQAVRSAVAELMRGDRLRIHGAGRRQAVCLARRDAGQAPCVSYRGGRRRARTRTWLGEGNEAERVTRRRLE